MSMFLLISPGCLWLMEVQAEMGVIKQMFPSRSVYLHLLTFQMLREAGGLRICLCSHEIKRKVFVTGRHHMS